MDRLVYGKARNFPKKTMPKSTAAAKNSAKKAGSTKTMPYDVAAQLRTPEEMAAYLDAWLGEASDDAAGIARARRHCSREGHGAGCKRSRS
jgi:hypothetical protein